MNPKSLLKKLPPEIRKRVCLQVSKDPRERPAWLVRVQRYRVIAQWRFAFVPEKAGAALKRAGRITAAALRAIKKLGLPARNRASLVTRHMPRNANPDLPRGIRPYRSRQKGGIVGYHVVWLDQNNAQRRKLFRKVNGSALRRAKALRRKIEEQALALDHRREKLFRTAMSQLGAHLGHSPEYQVRSGPGTRRR